MGLARRQAAIVLLGTLALGAGVTSQAQSTGDARRGRTLAYTCLGCHAIPNYKNAYPMYRVPKLAGQHADYLVAALQGYRNGERGHATMHAQASSLTDQDMQDIAAFISAAVSAPSGKSPAVAPPAAAQVCVACHGTDGVGITPQYPSLAGQYDDYLERALNEYRKGERRNPVMATFAGQLKDGDVKELAAYYSQRRPVLGTVPKRTSRLSARN
jgi:cytochrome c553